MCRIPRAMETASVYLALRFFIPIFPQLGVRGSVGLKAPELNNGVSPPPLIRRLLRACIDLPCTLYSARLGSLYRTRDSGGNAMNSQIFVMNSFCFSNQYSKILITDICYKRCPIFRINRFKIGTEFITLKTSAFHR